MMMMGMNPLDVFPDSIPRAKTCDVTRTHPPSEGLLFDKKLNRTDLGLLFLTVFSETRVLEYTKPVKFHLGLSLAFKLLPLFDVN